MKTLKGEGEKIHENDERVKLLPVVRVGEINNSYNNDDNKIIFAHYLKPIYIYIWK